MAHKSWVVLLLVVCVISGTPRVLSAWKDQQIKVSYRNIKMVVDGKTISSDTEPFIYEGRTFVPLRAISEAFGKDVVWDAATYTVKIGESGSPQTSQKSAMFWAGQAHNENTSWQCWHGNSTLNGLLIQRGCTTDTLTSGTPPPEGTKILLLDDPSLDQLSTLYSRVRDGSRALVVLTDNYGSKTAEASRLGQLFGVTVFSSGATADLASVDGAAILPGLLQSLQLSYGYSGYTIAAGFLETSGSQARLLGSVGFSDNKPHSTAALVTIGSGKCLFVVGPQSYSDGTFFLGDNVVSKADNRRAAERIADWLVGLRSDF